MLENKGRKTYVLDTSTLVASPYSIYAFDEHDVCIADITMEELDNLKSRPSDTGANAREVIRVLDKLRQEGSLVSGVKLPLDGGSFHIEMNHVDIELPKGWDEHKADNRILRVCKGLLEDGRRPILVSNDLSMRIKASFIGVPAEEFKTERVERPDKQYKGRSTVYVSPEGINRFYSDGFLKPESIVAYVSDNESSSTGIQLTVHEFLLLVDSTDPKHTALGQFDGSKIVSLNFANERPYDVCPRNIGQKFAQEALMAAVDDAPLVILKGPAGTAKTFYSLAVGLSRVVNKSEFTRILVARPNVKFDEDIGYLKGTEEEKISPLIRPIMDNLEVLTRMSEGRRKVAAGQPDNYAQDLFDRGYITAQAMAYMRGRSISNTWIIIDEAQNMTPTQAFGIISRAGVGSKLILAGDPDQIDNPQLDCRTNGLSYASERMKGSPLCWQVTFEESECTRSKLALEAINRMSPKGYQYA